MVDSDVAIDEQRLFLPFIKLVRDKRAQYKGTLKELFWKESGNSLYGKTAQGLKEKRVFNVEKGYSNYVPPSAVTNPFFAAFITGFIRV